MNSNDEDTIVRCAVCGQTAQVSFAAAIFQEWPRHCDRSMQLVETQADTLAVLASARNVVWSVADGNSLKIFTR